ncbi:MAG: hypothetical protein ACR2FO_03925 [Actinomycetota bacterium]
MNHFEQPYLVRLPPQLGRRTFDLLNDPVSPYRDFSELVAIALENLLTLGQAPVDSRSQDATEATSQDLLIEGEFLTLPKDVTVETASPQSSGKSLFVLTNRLNPIPVAARILLNMTLRNGSCPGVDDFVKTAGMYARDLGLRLRNEDESHGRKGPERRSVAWPVGEDASKSLDRFKGSFLLGDPGRGDDPGALVELGVATLKGGLVFLTELGLQLALAPSSLLGEASGSTCSKEQQGLLLVAVSRMPAEMEEIGHFLNALNNSNGSQAGIDRRLGLSHKNWTQNFVIAHRAAMLGRLRDLGLIETSGRGIKAVLTMTQEGAKFMEKETDGGVIA